MQTTETEIDTLGELTEYLPRGSNEQTEQLVESLKSEGMKAGIVICTIGERPGERFVLDGHKRYWAARALGIPLKIDNARTLHFETLNAALMCAYKLHAKPSLSTEQFDFLLAHYYFCFCYVCYATEGPRDDPDGYPTGFPEEIDPDSSAVEIVAIEFGVSVERVKLAAMKATLLHSIECYAFVLDGSITSVSQDTLEAFVKVFEADRMWGIELFGVAAYLAESNGGRLVLPGYDLLSTLDSEFDEPDDPQAELALDERAKVITWLIRDARAEWDETLVERLESKVLEAFKLPLEEEPKP